MKYLADTHILMWSFFSPQLLTTNIRSLLLDEDNDIYYSQVSLWEISIKYALGKLTMNGVSPEEFYEELDNSYYRCKDINNHDLITNYKLPIFHKDPFDRFLILEAIRNDFILLSVDKEINQYEKVGLKFAQ